MISMNLPVKRLVVRIVLGVLVFCVMFASVLGGWAYLQKYNDQKLLKEFAVQKMGVDAARAGQFMNVCTVHSNPGNCSAQRFVSRKSECSQVISKLRNQLSDCTPTSVEFKGQTIHVQLTGYSDKTALYLETTLMRQHALLNAIY